MSRASRPILLLVFSDPRRDLKNIKRETSGLRNIFRRSRDCEVVILNHPSLAEIEDVLQSHRHQIVSLHYAGHANGFQQLLESEDGEVEAIGAAGFAAFLANFGLRFVFLNGCSTAAQTEAFFAAGVPCVLATTADIDDEMATEFSLRFYNGLETGVELQTAYDEAVASAQAKFSLNEVPNHRGVRVGKTKQVVGQDANADAKTFHWQLLVKHESGLHWSLQQEIAKRRTARDASDAASSQQLEALLKKVESDWVNRARMTAGDGDAAGPSPFGSEIEIGKVSRPDVIDDPREAMIDYGGTTSEVIGADTTMFEIFERTSGRLLILGQPGSGKTTTMLELAAELVEQANRDPTQAVPVVLSLSTWNDPAQSFADWLQEQIVKQYFATRTSVSAWLRDYELILLLDGLDEVESELRPSLVTAIHEFLQVVGAKGIVVCSRFEEYARLPEKLVFGGAVHLQPLSAEQILDFVAAGGPKLAVLHQLLEQHEPLRNLAQSPLMLHVMTEVFQHQDVNIKPESLATLASSQTMLFQRFVDRMFRKRRRSADFSRAETESFLIWLAKQTKKFNISSFLIEELQPSWLNQSRQRVGYGASLSVLLALLIGATVGCFWWCTGWLSKDFTRTAVDAGLWFVPTPLFVVWFYATFLIDDRLPNFAARGDHNRTKFGVQAMVKFLVYLVVWAGFVSIAWLIFPATIGLMVTHLGMTGALGSMLLAFSGWRHRTMLDIEAVERLGWSSRGLTTGALVGGGGGFLLWIIFRLAWQEQPAVWWFWQDVSEPSQGYSYFLFCMLTMGAALGAAFKGITPALVKQKTVPNQGMLMSQANALRIGGTLGLSLFGLSFGLSILQNFSGVTSAEPRTVWDCLIFSIGVGVSTAVCGGLLLGGWDYLKHQVLKFLLQRSSPLPRDLVGLLEHTCHLNLMKRAGGSYSFFHRLLQDHFARQPSLPNPQVSKPED